MKNYINIIYSELKNIEQIKAADTESKNFLIKNIYLQNYSFRTIELKFK